MRGSHHSEIKQYEEKEIAGDFAGHTDMPAMQIQSAVVRQYSNLQIQLFRAAQSHKCFGALGS